MLHDDPLIQESKYCVLKRYMYGGKKLLSQYGHNIFYIFALTNHTVVR
jgi:hypothetical protein